MEHAASGKASADLPPDDVGAAPTGRQFTWGLFAAWATYTGLSALSALVYGTMNGGAEVVVLFSEQPLWQFVLGVAVVSGLVSAGALLVVAVPLFALSRPVARQSMAVRGVVWFAVGGLLGAAAPTAAMGLAAAVGAPMWSTPGLPGVVALVALFGAVAGLVGWTCVLLSRSR